PATGSFTYTSQAGAIGYDSFTLTVADSEGAVSNGTGMAFIVASSPRWPGQTIRAGAGRSDQTFVGTTGVYSADRRFWATTQISVFALGDSTPFRDVFVNNQETH